MDEATYIQSLIAQYLKDAGLTQTLSAFELEVNKKFTTPVHDESLESIVRDRVNFQSLSQFGDPDQNVNTLDAFTQSDKIKAKNIVLPNWSIKYPDSCEVLNLGTLNSLIISSAFFQAVIQEKLYNLGLFVTNKKCILVIDLDTNQILLSSIDPLQGQPIKLIWGITRTDHIIICDMNGGVTSMKFTVDADENWNLVPSSTSKPLTSLKLHRRLITDFKYISLRSTEDPSLLGYFASIGWDGRVTLGKAQLDEDDGIKLSVIGDYKLFTNPTSLLLVEDKKSHLPIVLVGRLESSLLTIFTITSHNPSTSKLVEIAKLSLNDAEFSSHSFQPMAIAEISSMGNDMIITIATDHVPYMRLITVLVPSLEEILNCEGISCGKTSSSSAGFYSQLAEMASERTENTESFQSKTPILRSYIISNFNSLSPQDKYSNAIILCRPHCSGLWIPGDDGKLRGFDLRTGTVIETLNSNDGRAKSAFIGKCGEDSEVIVVCGAVDKKICIWKCSS